MQHSIVSIGNHVLHYKSSNFKISLTLGSSTQRFSCKIVLPYDTITHFPCFSFLRTSGNYVNIFLSMFLMCFLTAELIEKKSGESQSITFFLVH